MKTRSNENINKTTSKVAYLWQFGFFFTLQPPKQPGINNSFYRFLYPMICGTISGVGTYGDIFCGL